MDSLRRLLRWIRGVRQAGRPPTEPRGRGRRSLQLIPPFAGYAALPIGQACRAVVLHLEDVEVDGRARDAVVRYFGLVGPPEPLAEVATTLRRRDGSKGLGVRRTQDLIEEAVSGVAAALPEATPPSREEPASAPGHPSPDSLAQAVANAAWARRLRHALLIAGGLARRDGGERQRSGNALSLLVALEQLQADAFGTPAPEQHRGRRIEPWLRYRLRTAAWAAVCTVDPELATDLRRRRGPADRQPALDAFEDRKLGPRRLASVDGPVAGEIGEALTCDPDDPDTAAWLLALAERAYRRGSALAWELSGLVRDAVRADGAPDDELASRALVLHAVLAATVSDPSALQAARMLERLAGPLHPYTLRAYLTVAAAWSAHRYSPQVLRLLSRRLRLLERLPPDPARNFYRDFLAVRLTGTLVESHALPAEAADTATRLLERLLSESEARTPSPPVIDLYRAWAELEARRALDTADPQAERHARRARSLVDEASRRLPPPPRLLESDAAPGVYGHRPALKWALAELRVHLAAGDRCGFERAQRRAAAAWAREPVVPFLGRAIQTTLHDGAALFGVPPEPLVAPDPATGWSDAFTPPVTALPTAPPAEDGELAAVF